MKQPPFIPKMKVCRKQTCAAPKWEVAPWTRVCIRANWIAETLELFVNVFSIVMKQCSVGCGKGYSTREVKCMLSGTKVNELMCRNQAKPIATQHCEITSDCKWKAGPWKPVNYYPIEISLLRFASIFAKHYAINRFNSVHAVATPNAEFSALTWDWIVNRIVAQMQTNPTRRSDAINRLLVCIRKNLNPNGNFLNRMPIGKMKLWSIPHRHMQGIAKDTPSAHWWWLFVDSSWPEGADLLPSHEFNKSTGVHFIER